jgi:hypothetical protein
MDSPVKIPNGEEKITIELSVKEALALSGERFNYQPEVALDARKKVKESLNQKFHIENHAAH